jgi:hypothetical protein
LEPSKTEDWADEESKAKEDSQPTVPILLTDVDASAEADKEVGKESRDGKMP